MMDETSSATTIVSVEQPIIHTSVDQQLIFHLKHTCICQADQRQMKTLVIFESCGCIEKVSQVLTFKFEISEADSQWDQNFNGKKKMIAQIFELA